MIAIALTFVGSIGASAQSWTASNVAAGNYYLYNVGTGQFFTKGNGWGTQASITVNALASEALQVSLAAFGENYKIVPVGSQYGLENLNDGTCYTDQSRGKNSTWAFTQVGTDSHGAIYNIISAENHGGGSGAYLTASDANTIVGPGTDGTSSFAKWQIVDDAQTAAIHLEFLLRDVRSEYQTIKNCLQACMTSDAIANEDPAISTLTNTLTTLDANLAAATTLDEATQVLANLKTAARTFLESAQVSGSLNITNALIKNPTPTSNANGWTLLDGSNATAQATFDAANNNAEFWSKTSHKIKQTLSNLPTGTYKLIAQAFTRTDFISTLYAGSASMAIATVPSSEVNVRSQANTWFNNGNGYNTLYFTQEATGDTEIGLITGTTGDAWTVWRGFESTMPH